MRIVLQKALRAACICEDAVASEIAQGYVVFVGFEPGDSADQVLWMARKILRLRLYDGWTSSIVQRGGEILLLSQFTLLAEFKGNRPQFNRAMDTEAAHTLFVQMADVLRREYCVDRVSTGVFGCRTEIQMTNDGPFTALLSK